MMPFGILLNFISYATDNVFDFCYLAFAMRRNDGSIFIFTHAAYSIPCAVSELWIPAPATEGKEPEEAVEGSEQV
jgi:hypothetical protein